MLKGGTNCCKNVDINFIDKILENIKEDSLSKEVAKKISSHSVNSCNIKEKRRRSTISRIFSDTVLKILTRY